MKVLVDTDILSELYRDKSATVRARAALYEKHHGAIALSVLSVFEVIRGWRQQGRADRVDAFLVRIERLEILPFDLGCARLAGDIGGALVRAGRTIGVVDVCLPATAIHLDRVLVSGNTAHFGFVREAGFDLKLENWRDDPG